jgi:predicted dehydrogenase
MTTWRIGLVGLSRGPSLARQFTAHPDARVTALCDLDAARLATVGRAFGLDDTQLFTDYAALLNSPIDVVVIATPIMLHAAQAIAALESGKHVLSEVTAVHALAEADPLLAAVRRSKRVYMMGENCCYYYFMRQWQDLVARGRLGRVVHAEAEYVHDIHGMVVDPHTGQAYWRAQRPPIHYCSHSLGPLLQILGDRVVKATGLHSGINTFAPVGPGVIDLEVGLFQTAKGTTIKVLRSSVLPREPALGWYVLYGTGGYVENGRGRDLSGRTYVAAEMPPAEGGRALDCAVSDPSAPEIAQSGGHGTAEYYMIREFLDAVGGKRPVPIDVVRALDYTVPGLIAHEAAEQGGVWLDVPAFG